LENLQTTELIRSFGLVIQTIINESQSLILLAFMRTLHWERFEEILDKSVIDKLGMNQFDLHGCAPLEVDAIIISRISEVLPDAWKEPAEWLTTLVKRSLHKNPSPREVINAANAIIRNADRESDDKGDIIWSSPIEIIGSAYSNERDQILSDLDAWPADYEELTKAVSIFLKSRNFPFSCKTLARKNILTITHQSNACSVIINTNRNHSAIGSSFSAGAKFLQRNPGSSCLYLTDPRCIITKPTWGQTNHKKDEFLSAGGRILQPSEGEIARFYALYSLSCKITEGDIQIETEDGVCPITLDELNDYVGNREVMILPIRVFVKNEYFIPFLSEYASQLSSNQIEAFAVACDKWLMYLSGFISPHLTEKSDPEAFITTIFHSSEYTLSSDYTCDDGEVVRIRGRPDALLFDPGSKEPVVLEYKGRKESDPDQDLAQTSLYAWLVAQSVGITPRVDLLYLEESSPLVRYDSSAVQALINDNACKKDQGGAQTCPKVQRSRALQKMLIWHYL